MAWTKPVIEIQNFGTIGRALTKPFDFKAGEAAHNIATPLIRNPNLALRGISDGDVIVEEFECRAILYINQWIYLEDGRYNLDISFAQNEPAQRVNVEVNHQIEDRLRRADSANGGVRDFGFVFHAVLSLQEGSQVVCTYDCFMQVLPKVPLYLEGSGECILTVTLGGAPKSYNVGYSINKV